MSETVSEEVRVNGITDGVIWKELLKFSAPLLVGNLFQQLSFHFALFHINFFLLVNQNFPIPRYTYG